MHQRLQPRGVFAAILAACVLTLSVASASRLAQADAVEAAGHAEFSYRTYRKWKLKLPEPMLAPVGPSIDFETGLGVKFATKLDGTRLSIDTDGDGETDTKAEGKEALITLIAKKGDKELPYSIRLQSAAGWRFTVSGAMVGKINGVKVQLIDQNLNGSYADFGADAMIVGRGKTACYLSRVANIGGQLFELSIAEDGTAIEYSPYTGDRGTLHLGNCKTNAKVLGAVVRSKDHAHSFELSGALAGLQVPAGTYEVIGGEIGLGQNRVKFDRGRSADITVPKGKTTEVAWGGPVTAEFAYQRAGDELHLSPEHVWYYGAAGEQYHAWTPVGKSPRFTISDKKTGREIAQSYFPGTC